MLAEGRCRWSAKATPGLGAHAFSTRSVAGAASTRTLGGFASRRSSRWCQTPAEKLAEAELMSKGRWGIDLPLINLFSIYGCHLNIDFERKVGIWRLPDTRRQKPRGRFRLPGFCPLHGFGGALHGKQSSSMPCHPCRAHSPPNACGNSRRTHAHSC